jgi:poly-gamma-glutamate capsule biosynthesis protein CapA/YwtB (metallophosphatase superfamily)
VTQQGNFNLAIAGDLIMNRRVSTCTSKDHVAILDVLRGADLAFGNCETLFHDYEEPHVYPAVEAGWSYMRSPRYIADEMRALGFQLMGTANNHMLDYSYGGMLSTHETLTKAGIAHTGSGRTLSDARAPAYVDVANHRIALVSMTTSSTLWSRAGNPYDGVNGRPGVNPLRYHFFGGKAMIAEIVDLAKRQNLWVARVSDREWQINPPGLHHTVTRYFEIEGQGEGMILDEDDVAGNLKSIRSAKANADIVIVHIHNHESDQALGNAYPAPFLPPFTRSAIDAGADVVVAQGCHAPIRGIEMHNGKPIFYDPGDLFSMSHSITRFPADFYTRHHAELADVGKATPEEGIAARATYHAGMTVNPVGGYRNGRRLCGMVPVLRFKDKKIAGIELNPFLHGHGSAALSGMPYKPNQADAEIIVDDLRKFSAPFKTTIDFDRARQLANLVF